MNPPPTTASFPQSEIDIGYAYSLDALIFVAGVPPRLFPGYLFAFQPLLIDSEFRFYNGNFVPEVNPATLIIVLGPGLNSIPSSVLFDLSQLISRFTSLRDIEFRIHDSVWSRHLVEELPILPPTVKRTVLLVSNLLLDGPELVRITYDANAPRFTASLVAALIGLHLTVKGYGVTDLLFMLNVHSALAAVAFQARCEGRIEISKEHSVGLRMSGTMKDARTVLKATMKTARAPEYAHRQYTLTSFVVDVPQLYYRDEFRDCIDTMLSKAPGLQHLDISICSLGTNETDDWMEGLRLLVGFHDLIHVHIAHPRPLNLSDADLSHFLRSWRNAEHVSLNPKASAAMISRSQVMFTTNALNVVAYEAPRSLRHLRLFVDADKVSVFGTRGFSPHVGVGNVELRLLTANPRSVRAVMRMAEGLFPNARVMEV
ncbi:hypothetical protein EV361DRAFT_868362 [Lentinula raphanica]|uniref:Uncharacterized protein n=1 Tax=Lentinula raphanica TaxID=153919 RepID=A0AA38PFX6_9AGAR|nr:hypothetical protein F5880DRAFT_1612275 [Lentinula raphanica]KAJ3842149.1 hypothetical protein F5878DRAFT_657852 [Lentinula raphanica]KAJ3971595.1 hypothetical protein EV361DRAFT_868362 [Lentinula raphanica]